MTANEEPAGIPPGGKPASEPPATLVVLQPDGQEVACAVRLADVSQHGDPGDESGSGARMGISQDNPV